MELYKLGVDNMVESSIREMISLTDKKLKELKGFLNLKLKQKEAIEKENMEDIESTLNTFQSKINAIDEIDSTYLLKLNELKVNLGIDSISQINSTEYPCIDSLIIRIDEINATLKAINVIDDENNLLMKEKLEGTKEKLKNLRQGQKMNKSYNAISYGTMFIDQKN
ncbi:flagellar export chaperone FlgN [Brassicibacter mesophilus]|uniref:flagellar export chaperone FlgN n=1 Tax=Brassicibacter mesophilus TaxID=745119 RepID=UPI003D1F0963